jgi:thiosulfate dehydrogenase
MVPPLWGSDSFNDGAGMARLITAANFVHFNMPHGTDYLYPQLTVEQAWDVAAYMISQPRPTKADLAKDFPDLLTKPIDTPYGPYADGFDQRPHVWTVRSDPGGAHRGTETRCAQVMCPSKASI